MKQGQKLTYRDIQRRIEHTKTHVNGENMSKTGPLSHGDTFYLCSSVKIDRLMYIQSLLSTPTIPMRVAQLLPNSHHLTSGVWRLAPGAAVRLLRSYPIPS